MKLLYKFASRSRPERLFKCLDNMQAMMLHTDYEIQITADTDDETMFNVDVRSRIESYSHTFITYGTSTDKICAINRDMPLFQDWDVLINMSDDMEFISHGFDLQILADYATLPLGDVLMHYPDQAAGAALITMAIMDRKYYNRFGYIYNPEYKSLFCDNEQQEVAKLLGRYKFFKRRLFNHNHPAWGLQQQDALGVHTESFWKEDEATYNRRKAINFDIK
jgi:hypothetical protein